MPVLEWMAYRAHKTATAMASVSQCLCRHNNALTRIDTNEQAC